VNGLEKIGAGGAAEHVRVYIYIHETPRSIMAETGISPLLESKSDEWMNGYAFAQGNIVMFFEGYDYTFINDERIWIFESDLE
jgi:hypothetical protein